MVGLNCLETYNQYIIRIKINVRASKMSQQVMPGNLSYPETHIVKERKDSHQLSSDYTALFGMLPPTHRLPYTQ